MLNLEEKARMDVLRIELAKCGFPLQKVPVEVLVAAVVKLKTLTNLLIRAS